LHFIAIPIAGIDNQAMTFREALIYSSCRRRPASSALKTLDPGMRRDDDKGIDQRFLGFSINSLLLAGQPLA